MNRNSIYLKTIEILDCFFFKCQYIRSKNLFKKYAISRLKKSIKYRYNHYQYIIYPTKTPYITRSLFQSHHNQINSIQNRIQFLLIAPTITYRNLRQLHFVSPLTPHIYMRICEIESDTNFLRLRLYCFGLYKCYLVYIEMIFDAQSNLTNAEWNDRYIFDIDIDFERNQSWRGHSRCDYFQRNKLSGKDVYFKILFKVEFVIYEYFK